ncbi:MAG: ATP-binding cassette domain-containing protein [Anaerolineales bacterium]|nr:ATP-binding cassette domain-containing protein [Anaerolineales bacterium]
MLRVESISRRYDTQEALKKTSFSLKEGETMVITGPSGSGKTTLLRIVAGLDLPDTGEVYLRGELISRPGWAAQPHTRNMGFVFQRSTLWPHMTVGQNILYGMHRLDISAAEERMRHLLAEAGLENFERRYPSQLSGGEARRVEILRALAPQPEIMLMDEPLTNLDPENSERLLHFIKENIYEKDRCLIYVTHDRSEAEELSSNPLVMEGGQLR